MARFRAVEGAEPQTLAEILAWHQNIADALALQLATIRRSIGGGATVPPRFAGMTEEELDSFHDAQRRELDRLTVLNLVASVEASIRQDYRRRVAGKLKDPLARAYRGWHKQQSKKKQRLPDFDEGGILDLVKAEVATIRDAIGQYRECLRARHWVGHGRYWSKPAEVDRLDPSIVYERCRLLLEAWPE